MYVYGGDVCKELKKFEEAFTYWEKQLKLDKNILDSAYSMALCYEEQGDYENAYKTWNRIVEFNLQEGMEVETEWLNHKIESCRERM